MEPYLTTLLFQSSLPLNQLKQIHALIISRPFNLTPLFLKTLFHTPFIGYARDVFDQIPQPDSYIYSSMISAYAKLSMNNEVLGMFSMMHKNNTQIVDFAFPPLFKSCAVVSAVNEGKQVHSLVVRYGFGSNVFIQSGLIDFYAKSGDLNSAKVVFDGIIVKDPVSYNCLISGYSKSGQVLVARKLFDDMPKKTIVSWNSMISCYAHNGELIEGIRIFERMQAENCVPNERTLVTVLSICAKLGDLEMGLDVKKCIDDSGLRRNMIVSTAILEMYVKCGAVDEARREFDEMPRRDLVTWGAMITGYAQNGRSSEALELFERMKSENFQPNDVTIVSVLSACAQLGSVETAEQIGSYVEEQGFITNIYVASALLDMYAKCGNVRKARQLFDGMSHRDLVTWNSMIGGLAVNGYARDAIDLFLQMKNAGVKPRDITFVGLLTACTHAGLVDLGCEFYESMTTDYGIVPRVEHCACMVDLFCRSGRLEEAYKFITKMEIEPNVVIWGTLLSACRIHLNVELAELSVEKLLVLEPENSANYVLLCNIYSSTGRWQEALKIRSLMREKSVQKTAAYSWIEIDGLIHKFLIGEASHPRSDEIYNVVDALALQLQLASGHLPKFDLEFS
ncbi:hypothetical protein Sjap_015789 [Stephania japonica]|uniref:Pentatricopeptide repeat-containing protein n=1 Tax=Stephania japonica TaxID=461633 RepID=A0AAP0NR73_9MAGN